MKKNIFTTIIIIPGGVIPAWDYDLFRVGGLTYNGGINRNSQAVCSSAFR